MKEALKLALEFLEDNEHYVAENERHIYVLLYNEVIKKCKAALEQPAQQEQQEPMAWYVSNEGQPVTEPTFYRKYAEQELAGQIEGCGSVLSELYTSPPQRQPESTTDMMMELADRLGELPDDIDPRAWSHLLVYAPKKQWVGLTDDEIREIHSASAGKDVGFATGLTEAKLKDKNNG